MEYFDKALAIARELKDRKGEGQSLANLGMLYWHRGQYDKAVEYYEKSLAIARELKDRKGEVNPLVTIHLRGGGARAVFFCSRLYGEGCIRDMRF